MESNAVVNRLTFILQGKVCSLRVSVRQEPNVAPLFRWHENKILLGRRQVVNISAFVNPKSRQAVV